MNKINQQKNIQNLSAKIKELEEELCFRTRNYLYQNSNNPKRHLASKSKITQTEELDAQKQLLNESKEKRNKESTMYTSHLVFQESYTPSNHYLDHLYASSPISQFVQQVSPEKNHEILQKIEREKSVLIKLQFQETPFSKLQKQSKDIKDPSSSIINQDEELDFNKLRKKLYKEIKQLRRRLQVEENINKYTKRGLLISQEQNYQFRLKIKKLEHMLDENKMRQSEVLSEVQSQNFDDMLKNEKIGLLEEQRAHQKKVKEEYLDSLLAAEQNVCTLQLQIQRITKENHQIIIQLHKNKQKRQENLKNAKKMYEQNPHNNQLHQDQQSQQEEDRISVKLSFLDEIKEKSYAISNCIPIVNDYKDINLFKPESQDEIIAAFIRILDYCRNIQKWEEKRLSQSHEEKQIFINFLKNIAIHIDNQTKEKISRQIIKIQKFGYLLKIFKPSSSLDLNAIINEEHLPAQNIDAVIESSLEQSQQRPTIIC